MTTRNLEAEVFLAFTFDFILPSSFRSLNWMELVVMRWSHCPNWILRYLIRSGWTNPIYSYFPQILRNGLKNWNRLELLDFTIVFWLLHYGCFFNRTFLERFFSFTFESGFSCSFILRSTSFDSGCCSADTAFPSSIPQVDVKAASFANWVPEMAQQAVLDPTLFSDICSPRYLPYSESWTSSCQDKTLPCIWQSSRPLGPRRNLITPGTRVTGRDTFLKIPVESLSSTWRMPPLFPPAVVIIMGGSRAT